MEQSRKSARESYQFSWKICNFSFQEIPLKMQSTKIIKFSLKSEQKFELKKLSLQQA